MNIRSMITALATPDALRGEGANAVEMVFISASNELGAFESGALPAALIGAVPAVVIGWSADDASVSSSGRGSFEDGEDRPTRVAAAGRALTVS